MLNSNVCLLWKDEKRSIATTHYFVSSLTYHSYQIVDLDYRAIISHVTCAILRRAFLCVFDVDVDASCCCRSRSDFTIKTKGTPRNHNVQLIRQSSTCMRICCNSFFNLRSPKPKARHSKRLFGSGRAEDDALTSGSSRAGPTSDGNSPRLE